MTRHYSFAPLFCYKCGMEAQDATYFRVLTTDEVSVCGECRMDPPERMENLLAQAIEADGASEGSKPPPKKRKMESGAESNTSADTDARIKQCLRSLAEFIDERLGESEMDIGRAIKEQAEQACDSLESVIEDLQGVVRKEVAAAVKKEIRATLREEIREVFKGMTVSFGRADKK